MVLQGLLLFSSGFHPIQILLTCLFAGLTLFSVKFSKKLFIRFHRIISNSYTCYVNKMPVKSLWRANNEMSVFNKVKNFWKMVFKVSIRR